MEQIWLEAKPKLGDHIRVRLNCFYHHGIYINDEEVIQFGLPMDVYSEPEKVKVLSTSLSVFMGNETSIEVRQYTIDELKEKRSDEEIVKYALSKIGTGGYNLIKNNCEHFANECVFGKSTSSQIDEIYKNVELLLKGNK